MLVRELGGHCTPDEVYARVQRKSTAVNRATVYRTLDFLLKLGLVTTAHMRDNQVIYELDRASAPSPSGVPAVRHDRGG